MLNGFLQIRRRAGLIPLVTGRLINLQTQAYADKQSKGVFDATLGMESKEIAIDVAAIITNKIMENKETSKYIVRKEQLAQKVINQIDSLCKIEPKRHFVSILELVDFLCEPVIKELHEMEQPPILDPYKKEPLLLSQNANNSASKSQSLNSSSATNNTHAKKRNKRYGNCVIL